MELRGSLIESNEFGPDRPIYTVVFRQVPLSKRSEAFDKFMSEVDEWMTTQFGEPIWLSSSNPADKSLENSIGWVICQNGIIFNNIDMYPLIKLKWADYLHTK